ncbi:putative FBD domain, F-box-like domain superfamily protein [Helianthus annuus]|nr:putative FBD domain, leucine-rich repeat domain superfamily, F-box-like domain superfamily [Helianthus annuus]KAJ0446939.1 putative FBD domain, leucine-rich repeat domain superfamily, F-box-like domain superfamily [Helianthus annuus]KAJ0631840.1 putative FBD domain, leucine-rich repeat domain superfamily, F-box-like domain superfamily [Helianthus annuus]KAJ0635739.1 putative FBD domain, leucine-rich repeat domain superfamily, F-box-like domain superfamily [Helianthus annuus]KAJ0812514.1 puta
MQQKQPQMKAKRLSKVQRLSLDRISTLPQTIIETILCLLPIEEAARTSILSREWRFKWTTIPKLVFSDSTLERPSSENRLSLIDWDKTHDSSRCKLFYAIHQVLLLHQGPIHEFTLSADDDFFEIDQIILHLSRNHTLKKLTLSFWETGVYKLPSSVFSLHHLTDLHLEWCDIDHKQIFNGSLGSLTSLSLLEVGISNETLLRLLSKCPSLKRLCLFIMNCSSYYERPNIMELFKVLPVIEHLSIWGYTIPSFVHASVPEVPPASLIHLKYIYIDFMCFVDGYGLPFLADLIKCSPNLEKIQLRIRGYEDGDETEPDKLEEQSLILEEYSDVWLEHLKELEIKLFGNRKPELEFMKFILARSPNLKKVELRILMYDKKEELEMTKTLLRTPRASPVEIIVHDHYQV